VGTFACRVMPSLSMIHVPSSARSIGDALPVMVRAHVIVAPQLLQLATACLDCLRELSCCTQLVIDGE
jgi:hypothetical protein